MQGRLVFLLACAMTLAGCVTLADSPAPGAAGTGTVTVHRAGVFVDEDPATLLGAAPIVVERLLGTRGAEPTVGVTSTGAAFVISGDSVMRSRDGGVSWDEVYDFGRVTNFFDARDNSDPLLWVDTTTDRVYAPVMWPALGCAEGLYSDDEGETWTDRPMACGIPVVDHQKFATGPYVEALRGVENPVYPNVGYLCYNKLVATMCAVSFDGGLNYEYETVALRSCGGINGHPAAAPDGTVYVPAGRNCNTPVVAVSTDNGLTWTTKYIDYVSGQKEIDPEVTVTPDGTAYYMWRGKDQLMYVARSTDRGDSWAGPFLVSPPGVTSTNFAGMTSGDDGRVAFAFLGTRDYAGNPGDAPDGTRWHLFTSFSFDAAAAEPTFTTVQVTPHEDPVQIGYIWQGGGGDPGRNMLDFIDLSLGPDGRPWVAFTDGCTASCANTPTATQDDSRARDTAVAVLTHGASLRSAFGVLGETYDYR